LKKLFLYIIIGIFLSQHLVLAAKSQTGSGIWIIIDGPGVGIQIVSDSISGTNIPSNLNPTIQGGGTINPSDSGCVGDNNHYNGSLYGQADPGGCGWGHVVNYGEASKELQTITDALRSEENARLELKSDKPDYIGIENNISMALNYLDFLVDDLASRNKSGVISHKTINKLRRQINSVYHLDAIVKNNYEDAGVIINPNLNVKDVKSLSTAYDIKVRIVKQIVNLEPLLKANP